MRGLFLTLVVYLGDSHCVSAASDACFGESGWDGLEGEGHVGAGGGLSGDGLLSPEFVDVFVEGCVDLGGGATIVVASKDKLRNSKGRSGYEISYRAGAFENVDPKISVILFTVPFTGGTGTAKGARP